MTDVAIQHTRRREGPANPYARDLHDERNDPAHIYTIHPKHTCM
jgi:hypothetical protein